MAVKQDIDLGKARITHHGPCIAGDYTSLTWTYQAGHPIDDSGYLLICFRSQGDFGTPQFTDPGAPNFCTVSTDGNCRVTPRWDPKGYTRPWSKALYLQVGRGYLDRGETVTVVFGDTAQGSPGWRLQTFAEHTFEFKTLVDPIATHEFKELEKSPMIGVVPGPPARAVCIAPSQVVAGQGFTYWIKAEDRWGNPVSTPRASLHHGFAAPGTFTVEAADEATGDVVESNPIEVLASPGQLHPFWGDFHGQSEETIGSNSIEDYFRFARDCGLLDIAGHQGNDFQVTDDFWRKIDRVSDEFYEPGRLVTFAGYEWSGNTPLGGDRNVYFAAAGGRISHSSTDLLPGKETAYDLSPTATDLFADMKRSRVPAFVFAHVGGRYADMRMHDPDVELAVEIHSAWGTFEWLLEDALALGYRVGVVANSDDHKCRPGASYPGAGEFGSLGGLTCVLATSLDREGVYRALKSRHCYATTGNRPLVGVSVATADGRTAMMGDVVEGVDGQVSVQVDVTGTAALERVDVRLGHGTVHTFRPDGAAAPSRRIKVTWGGAEVRGRARMVRWDGRLKLTGSSVLRATPINFWNANWPLLHENDGELAWRSNTTGGLAGVILELAEPEAGLLEVETLQGGLSIPAAAIGGEPVVIDCGGLRKRIEVQRLAAAPGRTARFAIDVGGHLIRHGDNPLYVRVVQEDGHMAWTSPVYLVR